MEYPRDHYHPLTISDICCADHAYELISVYTRQKRDKDIFQVLLSFSEQLDTKFLLDNLEKNQETKLKLGEFYNKYAMLSGLDFEIMKCLLETSHVIYSSLPEKEEFLGFLATANSNLAFISKTEGDLENAIIYLNQADEIEKKIGDLTGNVMTSINKSAVLTELKAYHEAYYTIKESVEKLEKRIDQGLKKDQGKSSKFAETLQLLVIAYLNMVNALENIKDEAFQVQAKEKKSQARELCFRHLGKDHYLSQYFAETSKHIRNISSLASDFSINTKRSEGKVEYAKPIKKVRNKEDTPKKSDPSSKRSSRRSISVTVFPKKSLSEKEETVPTKIEVSPNRLKSKEAEQSNISIRIPSAVVKENAKFVRTKFSKSSLNSSNSRQSIRSLSQVPLVVSETPQYINNIVRIPGTNLPAIPARSCIQKFAHKYKFTNKAQRIYEYLLDPVFSPISIQLNFNISILKFIENVRRVITFSLLQVNNLLTLEITATTGKDQSDLKISELISVTDLQSLLNLLCVFDVLPSYMHPGFINSFEKFCKFYLVPFVKVFKDEDEPDREKIELWARGDSILPYTTQVFLDTECTIILNYVEKTTLRMIIASAAEDDSSEKCLRADIFLDEFLASSLIKPIKLSPSEENFKFIQSIETFPDKFIEHLDPIISEIELCIKDEYKDIIPDFEQFIKSNQFILIRANITGINFEKMLWTVMDYRKNRTWKITAKSLHSFNSSGRKRKLCSTYFYSYQQIYFNYGVMVDALENHDLKMLAFIILESMKIDSFEDDDFNGENCEDTIFVSPIKELQSFRYFRKDKYHVPVTLSIVGVNSYLIGVRASVFDIENCMTNSCWLLLDGDFYLADVLKVQKKRRHDKFGKGVLRSKLNETKLLEILEQKNGWDKISLLLTVKKNIIYKESYHGICFFGSLENILIRKK